MQTRSLIYHRAIAIQLTPLKTEVVGQDYRPIGRTVSYNALDVTVERGWLFWKREIRVPYRYLNLCGDGIIRMHTTWEKIEELNNQER